MLDGIGCHDAKLPCGSGARLTGDEVNVATEMMASRLACFSLRLPSVRTAKQSLVVASAFRVRFKGTGLGREPHDDPQAARPYRRALQPNRDPLEPGRCDAPEKKIRNEFGPQLRTVEAPAAPAGQCQGAEKHGRTAKNVCKGRWSTASASTRWNSSTIPGAGSRPVVTTRSARFSRTLAVIVSHQCGTTTA